MTRIPYILSVLFLLAIPSTRAQQTPAPKQSQPIAIMGGTAHLGNGQTINNSLIVFDQGKLITVADATVVKFDPTGMQVIEAKGKHVYPGFIIPNSTLGLVEIDAVRASNDEDEVGAINPNIRSLIAYNTESKVVETMRPNGVLIGQITPRGGRISGTSSIVQFDAWNWEDAVIKADDGIHMNWPKSFRQTRGVRSGNRELKPNKNYQKEINKITEFLNQSKAYNKGDKTIKDLAFEAVQGLFDGSKKLYIHVNDAKDISDAIEFKSDNSIKDMVIVGGYEAYKVADLLKEQNIPVLIQRVHSEPHNMDDDYDQTFKLASILTKAGVLVGLENSGDMERMNARNLPFLAGTTAAYGLGKEQALQLITLNTAKILGIDAHYGSLEVGKSATLFISEGDALDMRTNQLSRAFIDGRDISLESHQTELWKRYSNKYKAQKDE